MTPAGPVWGKNRSGGANSAALSFTSGWDVAARPAADARLAPHDLDTNAAHLLMLLSRRIVPRSDARSLAAGLLELRGRLARGEGFLRPECEDIHMSTEAALAEIAGPAAGRIHTARSRNDQAATDMRLWLREEVHSTMADLLGLHGAIASHARRHAATVCPGLSHVQPAMVTTWGHWCASYLPALERAFGQLELLRGDLGECPLGAAAGFGTSWPIDPPATAASLGFRASMRNSTDAVASRGEWESRFAFAASAVLATLARIAQDLINLSSPPRCWVRLDDAHVTGSSIMPQKRNPDFAEVMIARAAAARELVGALSAIPPALPGGYHRGLQWTKYLAFDAADNLRGALPVLADVFGRLAVDAAAMRAACAEGFIGAADLADLLASRRGIPFREAYRLVGELAAAAGDARTPTVAQADALLAGRGMDPLDAQERCALSDPAGLIELRLTTGSPGRRALLDSLDAAGAWRRGAARSRSRAVRAVELARTRLWRRVGLLAASKG